MKKWFRLTVGFLVVAPFVIAVYVLLPFIGKEKAIRFVGPKATSLSKLFLKFFIPDIKDASEFYQFSPKMKKNFWLWRPFYDFTIAQDDGNVFKLHVYNCPFCEAIIKSGLPELAPHLCQGDWEVAKENQDKWDFERSRQIGTGDSLCDHTYKRRQFK